MDIKRIRYWDVENHTFITSRYVVFHENIFPFKTITVPLKNSQLIPLLNPAKNTLFLPYYSLLPPNQPTPSQPFEPSTNSQTHPSPSPSSSSLQQSMTDEIFHIHEVFPPLRRTDRIITKLA